MIKSKAHTIKERPSLRVLIRKDGYVWTIYTLMHMDIIKHTGNMMVVINYIKIEKHKITFSFLSLYIYARAVYKA